MKQAVIGTFYKTKDEALRSRNNKKKDSSIVYVEGDLFQKIGYLVVKNSILKKCNWELPFKI